MFNYCYPDSYSIKDICEAFHKIAGYAPPKTIPKSLLGPSLAAFRLISKGDARGSTFAPSRIAKLTSGTRIEPTVLAVAGFQWGTTLNSALRDWFEADPRARFT